jgi:hypothetical protein
MHISNLEGCLRRGGLCAPNHKPNDGIRYQTIHDASCQEKRTQRQIPCGAGGVIHDYVPFYFGYLSPMLLRLKSGRVDGYNEGQEPLIYLCSTAQAIAARNIPYVFSDGHGLATFTEWFDDLDRLDEVDWEMVNQRYWADNVNDMDRQRRKQAEFLVHRFCPLDLIERIVVHDNGIRERVEQIFDDFDEGLPRVVQVKPGWYY